MPIFSFRAFVALPLCCNIFFSNNHFHHHRCRWNRIFCRRCFFLVANICRPLSTSQFRCDTHRCAVCIDTRVQFSVNNMGNICMHFICQSTKKNRKQTEPSLHIIFSISTNTFTHLVLITNTWCLQAYTLLYFIEREILETFSMFSCIYKYFRIRNVWLLVRMFGCVSNVYVCCMHCNYAIATIYYLFAFLVAYIWKWLSRIESLPNQKKKLGVLFSW